MTIYRFTNTMVRTNNLPADNVVNVWHLQSATDRSLGQLQAAAESLATNLYAGMTIDLSPAITRQGDVHRVEVSKVTPGAPGPADDSVSRPLLTHRYIIPQPGAAAGVPSESACRISLEGDVSEVPEEQGLIRPAARRRGGVYWGPLGQATLDYGFGEPFFKNSFLDAILNKVELAVTNWAAGGLELAVYSRSNGMAHRVRTIFADNAPDVIRRRSFKATNRTTKDISAANTANIA